MTKILIGTDPELFCFDSNNKPVSVHDLLPGSKIKPQKVPSGAIQVDGTAAEFNIEPAENKEEFLGNIARVSRVLDVALKAKNNGLILKAVPTVIYEEEYFESLPFWAKELGCEPDYDAYTAAANPKPDVTSTMRTGSGHIHIGWTSVSDPFAPEHFKACCDLVKELDATLYDMSHFWDSDTRRQELYGKPGAFRPKPYGVEYRVLSNAWLNEEWTQEFVYDVAYWTTKKFLDGESARAAVLGAGNNFENQLAALSTIGIPTIRSYVSEPVRTYG